MTNCCPRPRMRWNGAIGAIARCKKVSTVCAPKSRSRHELRLICGEKPGARGVATLFTPYMRHGQDESNPVSLLQCRQGQIFQWPHLHQVAISTGSEERHRQGPEDLFPVSDNFK